MGGLGKNSLPLLKKQKRTTTTQVGAAAWSLAVVATLLGLSHPAVDKVREKRESERERGLSRVVSYFLRTVRQQSEEACCCFFLRARRQRYEEAFYCFRLREERQWSEKAISLFLRAERQRNEPAFSRPRLLKKQMKKRNQTKGLLSRLWQLSVLACAVLGAAVFHEPWGRALIFSLRDLMGRGSYSTSSSNGSSGNGGSGVRVGFSSSPNKGI